MYLKINFVWNHMFSNICLVSLTKFSEEVSKNWLTLWIHSFFVARLTVVNCSFSDVTFATVTCIHTVLKKTINKRVLHCDICSRNLFNVLLYINAGLRKFSCFFGQQGYTDTRKSPYTFSPYHWQGTLQRSIWQGMEMLSIVVAICFVCQVHGNFHLPCHKWPLTIDIR